MEQSVDASAQARLELAENGRELAEYVRLAVPCLAAADRAPGEGIRVARTVRIKALDLIMHSAVIEELAAGATWAEIAEWLDVPESFAKSTYSASWERFRAGPALSAPGLAARAERLDTWYLQTGGPDAAPDAVSSRLNRP